MKSIVSALFLLLSTIAISQEIPARGKFKVLNAHDPVSRAKVKTDLRTIEINSSIDQIIVSKKSGADTIKIASVVKITGTDGWLFRGSLKGYPRNITFTLVNEGAFEIRYDQLIYKLREQ